MNTPSNESNRHITSLIEVYLAGGLNDEEKRAFDAHIAGCAACSAAMEESRLADTKLVDLFASARLDLAYEDRLIGKLRPSMRKRGLAPRWAGPLLHPMVRRIATGVAAAVVLGSVGYGMQLGAERQQRAEADADSVFLPVRLSADTMIADSRSVVGVPDGGVVYYGDITTPANKETSEYRLGDSDSDRFKLTKNLSAAHGGRGQEGEKAKDADEKLQQSRQRSLQGNGLVDQFGEKGDKEGLEESRVKLSLLEDKVKGGKPGGVPDGERGANADKPASADHSESEFLRKLSQEEPSSASKTASANGRHFWSEANAFVPAPDDGKKSDSSLGRNKESAGGDQKEQKGKGSGHSLPWGSVDGTPSVALGIVNRDASWSSPFTDSPRGPMPSKRASGQDARIISKSTSGQTILRSPWRAVRA